MLNFFWNPSCTRFVISPGTPSPTGWPSISTIGITSAVVELMKISCACKSSSLLMRVSSTRHPSSWQTSSSFLRVMPFKIRLFAGCVRMTPSMTAYTFEDVPSVTKPSLIKIASNAPASDAFCFSMTLYKRFKLLISHLNQRRSSDNRAFTPAVCSWIGFFTWNVYAVIWGVSTPYWCLRGATPRVTWIYTPPSITWLSATSFFKFSSISDTVPCRWMPISFALLNRRSVCSFNVNKVPLYTRMTS